jgi:hypothetical protein
MNSSWLPGRVVFDSVTAREAFKREFPRDIIHETEEAGEQLAATPGS